MCAFCCLTLPQIDTYLETIQQEFDQLQDGRLTSSSASRGRLIQGMGRAL
jgi:hypothetical protein